MLILTDWVNSVKKAYFNLHEKNQQILSFTHLLQIARQICKCEYSYKTIPLFLKNRLIIGYSAINASDILKLSSILLDILSKPRVSSPVLCCLRHWGRTRRGLSFFRVRLPG